MFERLSKLVREASQVHCNLAMIASREGRFEEAEREMGVFRELRSRQDEQWNRQNELHQLRLLRDDVLESGDDAEAARVSKRIIEAGAETGDLVVLGETLLRLRTIAEAAAIFDRVLEGEPYHRGAISGRLRAAEAAGDTRAVELYRERLALLVPICSR